MERFSFQRYLQWPYNYSWNYKQSLRIDKSLVVDNMQWMNNGKSEKSHTFSQFQSSLIKKWFSSQQRSEAVCFYLPMDVSISASSSGFLDLNVK